MIVRLGNEEVKEEAEPSRRLPYFTPARVRSEGSRPAHKKLRTATACDTQWRANREERTQRSGINSTAAPASALRKTPWLAHSLTSWRLQGKGCVYPYPLLRTYLPLHRILFPLHPFFLLPARFPIYAIRFHPHRSSSTTVCLFGYNTLSISHCHTSSDPIVSHFYFTLFLSPAECRLVLFSRSSYLIGHFVLHRPRYYRSNSCTKRRATGHIQWRISANTTSPRQLAPVSFFLCRCFYITVLFTSYRDRIAARSFVRSSTREGNLEYSVHRVVYFPFWSFVFIKY